VRKSSKYPNGTFRVLILLFISLFMGSWWVILSSQSHYLKRCRFWIKDRLILTCWATILNPHAVNNELEWGLRKSTMKLNTLSDNGPEWYMIAKPWLHQFVKSPQNRTKPKIRFFFPFFEFIQTLQGLCVSYLFEESYSIDTQKCFNNIFEAKFSYK